MVKVINKNEPKQIWITTNDNPFDPFLEFEKWYKFDEEKGYKTCERLSRMSNVDYEMFTESENRIEMLRAMNFLCDLFDDSDLYRLVTEGEGRIVGVPAHIKDVITPLDENTTSNEE